MTFEITKLDYEGRGIAYQNGKVCFIKHALPQEVVNGTLLKEAKKYAIYEAKEIIKPSSIRTESFCPFATKCGGCVFSHVSYENSLKLKQEMLKSLFQKELSYEKEIPIIPANNSLGYRNKINVKVRKGKLGYYKEESHDFIPIRTCFIASPVIQNLLKDFSLFSFQDGELIIRINTNEEILLDIITKEPVKIAQALTANHKIAGISINHKCVYGTPFFYMNINHILYKVHEESFFQTNFFIAQKILTDVLSFFEPNDIVYDFYCGVGFFSLPLAKKVARVLGIEENPKAILDATYNASLNQITNASFHVGKVENIIDKISITGNKVLVDPPREGLHKNVCQLLNAQKFDQIIYISCNPKTLVRDYKKLAENYEIISLKAYDMFPFTKHVECVALLNKRKNVIKEE